MTSSGELDPAFDPNLRPSAPGTAPNQAMVTNSYTICILLLLLSLTATYAEVPAQSEAKDVRFLNHERGGGGLAPKISSREQAAILLHHYGYLKCAPSKSLVDSKLSVKLCTDAKVREAMLLYQKKFALKKTGVLDAETLKSFNKPRCGVQDDVQMFQKDRHLPRVEDGGTVTLKMKGSRKRRSIPVEKFRITPDTEAAYRHLDSPAFRRRKRAVQEEMRVEHLTRSKRSVKMAWTKNAAFNSQVIRWRYIAPYSRYMDIQHLRFSLRIAFRYWAEVCHLIFIEDNVSDIRDVDIEIGFGEGNHFNCMDKFDGSGGVIAHTQPRGPIHFDDAENYKLINLLRSIVHEIGHALGLPHIFTVESIMIPSVPIGLNGNFELTKVDRNAVQEMYGKCTGRFDSVIDWIQTRHSSSLKYNSYIFRGNLYWLYNQTAKRPRYGDPSVISWGWPMVPDGLDAVFQVWEPTNYGYNVFSAFIKGSKVYVYDGVNDRVKFGYPKDIRQVFGKKSSNGFDIPSSIDTAYFDRRTSRLYFFKDEWVYIYDPGVNSKHLHSTRTQASGTPHITQYDIDFNKCCDRKVHFSSLYRMAASSRGPALTPPIDAAYYSNSRQRLIFFKGEDFWIDRCFDLTSYSVESCIEYVGKWNTEWHDVCGA